MATSQGTPISNQAGVGSSSADRQPKHPGHAVPVTGDQQCVSHQSGPAVICHLRNSFDLPSLGCADPPQLQFCSSEMESNKMWWLQRGIGEHGSLDAQRWEIIVQLPTSPLGHGLSGEAAPNPGLPQKHSRTRCGRKAQQGRIQVWRGLG